MGRIRETVTQACLGIGVGTGVAAGVTLAALFGLKKTFPGANILEAEELALQDVDRSGSDSDA